MSLTVRYKVTKRKAEELLRSLEVTEPPVPVERIARSLGLAIRYEPFDGDLSGLLQRRVRGGVLGVNSLHSETRQRFTIAHEIGHYLLHDDPIHVDEGFSVRFRDGVSAEASDPAEIEANRFAANLIMPETLLLDDFAKLIPGRMDWEEDAVIRAFAKRYKVSVQAMTLRLSNLLGEKL
jgi:Zn-dependent peptidase ImmA (M78 family)